MASPRQRRGTCGHAMALFDSHTKCARCREKGVGKDACLEEKPGQIYDSFSEKKRAIGHPHIQGTQRVSEENRLFPPPPRLVDPSDVTVLGPISERDLSPDLDLNLRLWS